MAAKKAASFSFPGKGELKKASEIFSVKKQGKAVHVSKKGGVIKPATRSFSAKGSANSSAKGSGSGSGPGSGSTNSSSSSSSSRRSVSFSMNKSLGQHLLRNPGVVEKIVNAAEIKSTDVVLEVGPGTGNLTVKLCRCAKKVIGMDLDMRMINEVKKRCLESGYTNLTVIHGNALKSKLPDFHVCVANLPYLISSPFLFRLLSHKPTPRSSVLMFQKEFVDRLCAQPNDRVYSRLTVNVKLLCNVTRVCNVDRKSFNPPPKVDSAVVKLIPKFTELNNVNVNEWDGLLRVCFQRKRRTLKSVFGHKNLLKTLWSHQKGALALKHQTASSMTEMTEMTEEATPSMTESLESFRDFILNNILVELADRRTISLNVDEFLQLLSLFHKYCIFFVPASKRNRDTEEAIIRMVEGDDAGNGEGDGDGDGDMGDADIGSDDDTAE